MHRYKIIYFFFFLILFSGCFYSHKYSRPVVSLPDDFHKDNSTVHYKNIKWWKLFNDAHLNYIVKKAILNNDNLKLAVQRIREAEAVYRLTKSEQYPSVNGSLNFSRNKISRQYYGYNFTKNDFLVSSSVSYEADIWNRLKNSTKVSLLKILSLKANRDALKLKIISEVVNCYLNIAAVNKQIKISSKVLEKYNEIYKFKLKQLKHGIADELIVQQAKAEYENAKILIYSLKENKIKFISKLSLLTGETPKELFGTNLKVSENFNYNLRILPFLSSEILNNRPDIISAEEELKAGNINIAIAKSAFFPNINLTGLLGLQSASLNNLITSSAETWNLGGTLLQTIFDFGRIKANIKIAEAKKKEAVIKYVQTVKKTFNEVYDYLNRIKYTLEKIKNQEIYIKSLKRLLYLSKKKYRIGTVNYLTVLDAERRLLNSKMNLISYQLQLLNYKVLFYIALGCGY